MRPSIFERSPYIGHKSPGSIWINTSRWASRTWTPSAAYPSHWPIWTPVTWLDVYVSSASRSSSLAGALVMNARGADFHVSLPKRTLVPQEYSEPPPVARPACSTVPSTSASWWLLPARTAIPSYELYSRMLTALAQQSSNEMLNGYGRTVASVNPWDGYQMLRSRTQET